eukprot:1144515-Pelagomonas_calceolata.AAC.2
MEGAVVARTAVRAGGALGAVVARMGSGDRRGTRGSGGMHGSGGRQGSRGRRVGSGAGRAVEAGVSAVVAHMAVGAGVEVEAGVLAVVGLALIAASSAQGSSPTRSDGVLTTPAGKHRLQAQNWHKQLQAKVALSVHSLIMMTVLPIPAGMYVGQVWGTEYIKAGKEFASDLQEWHMSYFKSLLGVKRTITNWAVLRECGHEPFQFYWFRSVAKMYDSMLRSNSETLRRVLKADLNIHSRESSCWTAQGLGAL